jgi:hypothetical protein
MSDLFETTFRWLKEKLTGVFPWPGLTWVSNVTEFPEPDIVA